MSEQDCCVEGCARPANRNGKHGDRFCIGHYHAEWRGRNPFVVVLRPRSVPMERFMAKVIEQDQHLLWQAGTSADGDPDFSVSGGHQSARKWLYAQSTGISVSGAKEAWPTCGQRLCVAVACTEIISQAEGNRRRAQRKTHCPHGHEYSPENTYLVDGERSCISCRSNRVHIRHTWQRQGDMDISEEGVRERYGDQCHLCGMVVDRWLAWPDPWSFTVDHLVPKSSGGSHTWDNVRPSHFFCNVSKNSRDWVSWGEASAA